METVPSAATAGKQKQRPEPKIARVLAALIERPRTTRELERFPISDHVGHSTAADLRRLRVEIVAERVEVPGFAGEKAYVARYSIPEHGLAFAREVLARMRERRGSGS